MKFLGECKIQTPIEELAENIEFTKEHIKTIRLGGDIKWGNDIVMSKAKYIEGAYIFLKNQKAELIKMKEEYNGLLEGKEKIK